MNRSNSRRSLCQTSSFPAQIQFPWSQVWITALQRITARSLACWIIT